jgi:hypothetical protein
MDPLRRFRADRAGLAGNESLWIDPVPEPETAKNRVHRDVDLTGPDPSALVAEGASVLRASDDEISWWIMADPEGNEFCAFARRGG